MKIKTIGFSLVVFFLILTACGGPAVTQSVDNAEKPTQASMPTQENSNPEKPTEQVLTETAATQEPTVEPTSIAHLVWPAEPGLSYDRAIKDLDSFATAADKSVASGDDYPTSLFERPFNPDPMDVYYPEIDITSAEIARSADWIYFTIQLHGFDADGKLSGFYGVEVDLNVDGRAEYLMFASNLSTEWSADHVEVWTDPVGVVGGSDPLKAENNVSGSGYSLEVFRSGVGEDSDLAWARLSPDGSPAVQLAFKTSLIQADEYFMWGVLAQKEAIDPASFDIVDHLSLVEAGSPIAGSNNYPIKALYAVDNTCRWVVGLSPNGYEPRLCPYVAPTAQADSDPNSQPGSGSSLGSVTVSISVPGTGILDANIDIKVYAGSCGGISIGDGMINESNRSFTINNLQPGTYCASIVSNSNPAYCEMNPTSAPSEKSTTISAGQKGSISFEMLCTN